MNKKQTKGKQIMNTPIKIIGISIAAFFLFITSCSSYYTVRSGEKVLY